MLTSGSQIFEVTPIDWPVPLKCFEMKVSLVQFADFVLRRDH